MINADAGTGKTTMLEMMEKSTKTKPILYLCFNTRVAKEAKDRMLSTTSVKTFNSLGHGCWASYRQGKTISLDKKKSATILRSMIDEVPKKDQGPIWDCFWQVCGGVGLAKSLGYIPEGKYPSARRLIDRVQFHAALEESPDDLTSDLIDAVLLRSIVAAFSGNIDFNDQIYMPALFGGIYPKFPAIYVDEYQDLNPTNHELLNRIVKHRIIGVGDACQNIYGFRGAKAEGMEEAKVKFGMSQARLSISFRCAQAIVENARWRVPHFQWIKPGGHVETLTHMDCADFADDCAIICRNNAPLFRLALKLLGHGRSVRVAGSDLGPKLVALMRRIGTEGMSKASLLSAIDDWLSEKLAKGSTTAQDDADCMKVFATHGDTLGQALAYMDHLFSQSGTIQLITGHKAKGLEWMTVYHLDPWLIREDEQDLNLKYVIETRAKDELYLIDSRSIR